MPFNSSKWALHNHYSRSSSLRQYLPPTAIFSRKTLKSFLSRSSSVFIKPDREHMGKGIIKVWKKNGRYTFVREKGRESHRVRWMSCTRKSGSEAAARGISRGGGYALKVGTALAPTLSKDKIRRVKQKLIQLGYQISKHFGNFRRRSNWG
ncbi:YheC/YheD family protein [Brevibacillus sp. NRS-1366]|uniref:YheC/YheD family protein n=1 Tax=Brevibacillus sp. NRS-1366 TaxID=3233899 RepID=UPI003D2114C3